MGDVTAVASGIKTEILKRAGQLNKADSYLSLVTSNRSVDLQFDSDEQRDDFKVLLDCLVKKEHGQLTNVDLERPGANFNLPQPQLVDNLIFEWLVFYASFGKRQLSAELKHKLLRRLNTSLL